MFDICVRLGDCVCGFFLFLVYLFIFYSSFVVVVFLNLSLLVCSSLIKYWSFIICFVYLFIFYLFFNEWIDGWMDGWMDGFNVHR